jgi:hypothetical protein
MAPTRRARRFILTVAVAVAALIVLANATAHAQTETLPFVPVADCYVDASLPTTNFNDVSLKLDGKPVKISYLRFVVTGVNGRAVQQARLRIGAGTATVAGGSVHAISNHTWSETAVTYDTRPAVDGPALSTLGALAVGDIAEFDLGSAVVGDGTYDFALDSTNSDGVTYGSSTATGQKPTLILTVAAGPEPSVAILQPANGAGFFVGDQITFQGTAIDAQDGSLSSSLAWSSDHDGALGNGVSVVTTLTQGAHTVTAAVTDSDGHPGSAQVQVTVAPPPPANTAPLVTITAPPDSQTLSSTTPVTFTGTADDLEDGPLTATLTWTSSVDGALGSGGSVTRTLSIGTHTITARAVDNGALPGSASIIVHVTAPTILEFTPTADAYVDSGSSSKNFGTAKILRSDNSPVCIAYLRFAVAGVGGRPITHAVLRMQVDSASGANANKGGDVRLVTDTAWSETGITYANRPATTGALLASRGTAVALNQVIDFDLGTALDGDGTKSFAIVTSSSDNVDYRSRESATPPKLVLTLGGNLPQVAITQPASGGVVFAGTTVNVSATATDVEDGDMAAQVKWASSLDGALPSGASSSTSTLQIGTHTITASATDSSGLTGQAQITLRVRGPNAPPTIAINAAADGASFPAGTAVTLTGTANDDFDGPISAQIQWSSSLSGALGSGASLPKTLAEGAHTITATVTDSDGASTSAQIVVTITPTAPVVTITSPAASASVFQGNVVTFAGSAIDTTSGDLSSALQWSSSLVANPIGSGASFSLTNLPVGAQVITASASDGSLVGQAQRTITVRPPNAAPQVAIQSPIDGAALLAAKPVLLSATANDAENGNLGAVVKWTSSRDGALGTGATRTLSTLTVGTHTLTASVTDLDGQTTTAQVTVTISPSTLTFNPIADTTVNASATTKNFGTATTLTADGSPVKQILLRFQVAGIGGFAIDQAHLLITAGTATAATSKAAGTVQRFDDNTWVETAVTYATRPTINGPVLAIKTTAVKKSQVIDFDVTSGVAADGSYNLALTTTNSDDVIYQSREGSKKPQLVVTLKQNTGPVLAITGPPSGTYANLGAPVTFTATATDAESGNLGAQIKWSSSIDGLLGAGASLTKTTLSPGAHTITASVTDPSGASAQAHTSVTIGHPPVVTITSPANQATIFTPQLPATLTATADDAEDGDLTSQLHWTSSLDGAIGDGGTISRTLSIGTHTITAAVGDSAGATAQPQITVRVRTPNTPPAVTISSPVDNASAPEGSTWTLTATANDDFDGPLTSQIQWSSSVSGALGAGGSLTKVLAKGPQTLTASVTDSDGITRTAQVNVTATLTPPVVTITAPAAGDLIFAGDPLTFTGSATDATDSDLSASLAWTSDIAGVIGSGAGFITSALGQGTHVVTASVKDSDNGTGQAQRTVVVKAANAPATLTVNSPANDAAVFVGKPVTFAATAVDPDDGNLSGLVHWTSDIDGAIGNGASFVVSTLSAGTHHLTASVTDLGGRTTTKAVTLTVAQKTMTFAADADTYVDAGATSTKFGTATTLIVDNSPVKQAFLRFTVGGIGGIPIAQVKLRLTTGSASAATSAAGGSVHRISNTSWSEAATTYANKPTIDGGILATRATAVGLNEVVEFDVTSAVQSAGTYDFALDTTSSDDVVYQSREAASGAPQLVITLRDPDAPTVTISTPVTGTLVQPTDSVAFSGSASDNQDGVLSGGLQWTSSLDGAIGTGASFSRLLSIGVHTVTAMVTDSSGSVGIASITVEVRGGGDIGYRDFSYPAAVEAGNSNEATAQKPESKLWYHDGTWWAVLYRTAAGAHRIHRLDLATQTWVDIGVSVDPRPESKQDVLWDGAELYMASRFAGSPAQNRLYRFSYQSALKTWTLDSGFPVDISGGGTESMTIAKDSTNTLWIAYTLNSTVVVNRTVGSDTQWGTPFTLPVAQGVSIDADDIAGVISMPGKIGVFWTNQKTQSDYFAWHADGDPATAAANWHEEVAVAGNQAADDHFNMKVASDGRLFVGMKTSRTGGSDILVALLVRATDGTWSPMHNVATFDTLATRPLVVLDEAHRRVYFFFSPFHETINYKVSDMDTIAFPSGVGTPFMSFGSPNDLNNPQSTKQPVAETGGRIEVIASSRNDLTYFHNGLVP